MSDIHHFGPILRRNRFQGQKKKLMVAVLLYFGMLGLAFAGVTASVTRRMAIDKVLL